MGSELGSHGAEAERMQLRDAIERIKKALPRVTDAEQAEATRRDLRELEERYESISPRRPSETPYRNRYKCPNGDNNCGENARYCEPCNKRYEKFLWLLNDDR
jgi:hypothetical protein